MHNTHRLLSDTLMEELLEESLFESIKNRYIRYFDVPEEAQGVLFLKKTSDVPDSIFFLFW